MKKDLLVCPICHGQLKSDADELLCNACGLAYPVRLNIPVLLQGDARSLSNIKANAQEILDDERQVD